MVAKKHDCPSPGRGLSPCLPPRSGRAPTPRSPASPLKATPRASQRGMAERRNRAAADAHINRLVVPRRTQAGQCRSKSYVGLSLVTVASSPDVATWPLPVRVFMDISRKSDFASGKCYQALQDGVRYTVTAGAARQAPGPHSVVRLQVRARGATTGHRRGTGVLRRHRHLVRPFRGALHQGKKGKPRPRKGHPRIKTLVASKRAARATHGRRTRSRGSSE